MTMLLRFGEYTRKEVHYLFVPDGVFTPRGGPWGAQGIVRLPNSDTDFVFFVTLGQEQSDHVFDEGISEEGVLTWQSQPRQDLQNPTIQKFINHDHLVNNIYLFFRTKKSGPYTYLGLLEYLDHDIEREKPVYFHWQILDWGISDDLATQLQISPSNEIETTIEDTGPSGLTPTPPPERQTREGVSTSSFRSQRNVDYAERDAKNKQLGNAGELLVLDNEKKLLIEADRADLAELVTHVSQTEGDSAGYDIRSYTKDGNIKYIEVKTTKGSSKTAFFMSRNEVAFSQSKQDEYYLYRVYDYKEENNSGKFYIHQGNITDEFELTPTNYRVKL